MTDAGPQCLHPGCVWSSHAWHTGSKTCNHASSFPEAINTEKKKVVNDNQSTYVTYQIIVIKKINLWLMYVIFQEQSSPDFKCVTTVYNVVSRESNILSISSIYTLNIFFFVKHNEDVSALLIHGTTAVFHYLLRISPARPTSSLL
jgi:hypothetical protein